MHAFTKNENMTFNSVWRFKNGNILLTSVSRFKFFIAFINSTVSEFFGNEGYKCRIVSF